MSGEAGRSSSKRVRHNEQGMFHHTLTLCVGESDTCKWLSYWLWLVGLPFSLNCRVLDYYARGPCSKSQLISFNIYMYLLHYTSHVFTVIKSRATLIICPASLIHHWHKEIERRVKGKKLQVLMYHGQGREKDILRYKEKY